MALYSNFARFYPKNMHFWAKKWRSIQDGVLIKSGALLARIRYSYLGNDDHVMNFCTSSFENVHNITCDFSDQYRNGLTPT